MKSGNKLIPHALYLLTLLILFLLVQQTVFKKAIDLNGDNATYYTLAQSIAQGKGYANIMQPSEPKTNSFPPGYPLLMSCVMMVSDAFAAQKVFNSLLLFSASLLLYFILYRVTRHRTLSAVSAALSLVNYLLLTFSTIMMSETAFVFFSALSLFFLYRMKCLAFPAVLKSPSFYLLLACSAYAYYIRTQGIALVLAFAALFLIRKQWKTSLLYVGGFFVCLLPWMIRNHLAGISANRYLHQVLAVNHWRPEEGLMTFTQLIERIFSTTKMLITQAIPDSILPSYVADYSLEPTLWMWISGSVMVGLIVYGFFSFFKEYAWFYLLYIVFSCGIIALWSAPSQNRYLVSLVPFLQIGLLLGMVALVQKHLLKKAAKRHTTRMLAAIVLLSAFFFVKDLKRLGVENQRPPRPAFENYFAIARAVKKAYPKGDAIVCSRKPSLFFLYSGCYGVRYAHTLNDTTLIQDLLTKRVGYVVLDQLGYSSTQRYLYPVIQKHQDLFPAVLALENPNTYLLQFDSAKARSILRLGASRQHEP